MKRTFKDLFDRNCKVVNSTVFKYSVMLFVDDCWTDTRIHGNTIEETKKKVLGIPREMDCCYGRS